MAELTDIASLRVAAREGRTRAVLPVLVETVTEKASKDGKPFLEIQLVDARDRFVLRVWSDNGQFTSAQELATGACLKLEGEFTVHPQFGLEAKRWSFAPLTGEVKEEFLAGPEVSLFFLSDGTQVMPLAPAQDYKRAYDNNEGPNTGGMGAYSPLPWLPKNFVAEIQRTVAEPTIAELASRGMPFVGLLYCGLILTDDGVKVIEFNARFGDPETQVVLARLTSPLAPLLLAAAQGDLTAVAPPKFSKNVAITVVLASEGYPENPRTGREIDGLDALASNKQVRVAHAGTGFDGPQLLATGGRVLSVVSTGKDFEQARERAYAALEKISLEGSYYRRDIAQGVSA